MVPADKKPAWQAQYFNNEEINTEIIFTFETTIKINQTLCTKYSGTKNPIFQKALLIKPLTHSPNAEIPAIGGYTDVTANFKEKWQVN